ncbi:putative glycosyl transferase [Nocardioides dokdonensis FR1436]|uniref:Putative glycosyl transferase n=1 Tax=Nocardioides dokdonensis FR1436 TaxID=1300347 RepID=A0A1A9GJE4_9ACTN|nr:glycosyltransferase family 4 protein [Nocardioides dokdonensis]ANH38186.1 putative glycosyl transferase [Nocardioides dokdonensis FR1436]
MKIAFITQWYDPEVGSAALPGAIVRALVRRGHSVEVITGFPNYPTGEIYAGYKVRPYSREVIRGVTVHRVPLYPSHDGSALRRVLNFLSFMLSVSSLGALLARRGQVALVYSTPGTVGMAGLVLRRLLGRPFVLFIQDVWPDTVTATGMLPARFVKPSEWLLHRFCNATYRAAGHIAVISPGMKTLLLKRGVPADKVSVVFNWVDEEVFRPRHGKAREASSPLEVMYAGNIGDVQGLDTALRAVAAASAQADIVLRIIGTGVALESLIALAAELDISDRVRFEGPRLLDQMAEVMASADVQLVCLKDDPLFALTMPSKIQAILACGRPILTCAPGDAAALSVESGAGWACPAGDVEGLARLMVEASRLSARALADRGRAGRQFYESHLSAIAGSESLEIALSKALETA